MITYPHQGRFKGNLLLIHGMCHGAFCWPESFIQPFREAGYGVHAFDLPGHEKAGRYKAVNQFGIKDYVNALKALVDSMEGPIWLMGHSMGGFVVQKYLENHQCDGAILLTPVPYSGILPASLRYLLKHPAAIFHLLARDIYGPFVKHAADLYHHMPEAQPMSSLQAQMRSESFKALLNMMFNPVQKPARSPLLVVGAAQDQVITLAEIDKTVKFHQAMSMIEDNNGHNLMLEPGNELLARRIIDYIGMND